MAHGVRILLIVVVGGTVQHSTVRYGTVGDLRFKEIVIIDMCRLSTKKNDYFRVPVVRVIYVTICVKLDINTNN